MRCAKPKVFKWSRKSEWRKTFFYLLGELVDETVLAETRFFNETRFLTEHIDWLNEVITRKKDFKGDIQMFLAERLQKHYDFAIAFHGCRPNSIESYKKHGLRQSDTAELRKIALSLFGDTPSLHEAFQELRHGYGGYEQYNNGKVFFSVTKEALMTEWSGYPLDGSEFLTGIANRLNATDKLIGYGKPSIMECLISREQLDLGFWKSIAAYEIENTFNELLFPKIKCCKKINAGFHVFSVIPPERIKFHFPNEFVVQRKWRDYETNEIRVFRERKLSFRPTGANSLGSKTHL